MLNSGKGEMMNSAQLNDRGQVTIPKKIREQANIKPNDPANITATKQGQIIITKRDFFDDFDDLIKRDLVSEGLTPYELESRVEARKKELTLALFERLNISEKELSSGDYVTLDELKNEIDQ
ncbi:MAG: AbrB/MazE/SpoVT family DNA-binding domain-containing protein [Dethiobacteria bacterium]|nr:AbrB/MazE/SpoVT family DNA-binding domain-containing protein [Dethiobacteria bacterium]